MQISALNLIVAAQQARQTSPQRPPVLPADSKSAGSVAPSDDFSPLTFKSNGENEGQATRSGTPPTSVPPGSQVDIRV